MAKYLTGTYTGTYTLSTNPTTVTSTGTIDVNSMISGAAGIFGPSGTAWALTNLGTIESLGNLGTGVNLMGGGAITNGMGGSTTALIEASGLGLRIAGGAGTVVNFGTIEATDGISGTGVNLINGGTVVNQAGGSINAPRTAISISGAAGTVTNYGTISAPGSIVNSLGSITNGIGINAVAGAPGVMIVNGAASSTAAVITAYHIGVLSHAPGTTTTVVNFGTILSQQTVINGYVGVAIQIDQGGYVGNFGLIKGAQRGVWATNTAGAIGTVVNAGTIEADGDTIGNAIYLSEGGSVTNLGSGLIIANRIGVSVHHATATIDNFGAIQSLAPNSFNSGSGIYLQTGGLITNEAGAHISALRTAISIGNTTTTAASVTISNAGTITGSSGIGIGTYDTGSVKIENTGKIESTSTGTTGVGVNLRQGGELINQSTGTITAYRGAISVAGTAGTLTNNGTIQTTGTIVTAVALSAGGTLSNHGLINGAAGAVSFKAVSGTVNNFGTVVSTGTFNSGVYLGAGGSVINTVNGIINATWAGVDTRNAAATVTNIGSITSNATFTNPGGASGTLKAVGVILEQGGLLTNGAPVAGNGTVVSGGPTAVISAYELGVYIGGARGTPNPGAIGTLVNYGLITTTATGTVASPSVELTAGGTVINRGTIANNSSYSSDVRLTGGGTVFNYGLLSSARTGVSFGNTAGTIVNLGTILSTVPTSFTSGSGVYLQFGGVITNGTTGIAGGAALISAQRTAISIAGTTGVTGGATITNFGTVVGSKGINIGALDTGINTIVNYGTIIGSAGIAVNLGNAGGQVVVLGSGSNLVGVIANVQAGDVFDLPFSPLDPNGSATLGPNNQLQVVENGGTFTIALDPAQPLGGDAFILGADGSGGTKITVNLRSGSDTDRDFNGDGKQDVLLRSSTNGSFVDWTINGPAITSADSVTFGGTPITLDASWSLAGTADLNGDGRADILLRNPTTDGFVDFTMNGPTITAADNVTFGGATVGLDSSWSVLGTGDFNGDGKVDVLLHNTNGSFTDFTMNGSAITSADSVTFSGTPISLDSSWAVVGTDDFNGDGKADILLRNPTINGFVVFTMNGETIAAADNVTFGGNPVGLDSSWSVLGTGDFNGDGKADILLYNTDGAFTDFTMNGSVITAADNLTFQGGIVKLDSSWTFDDIGDFDGDGKADILYRNTNGSFTDFTMNGSTITAAQNLTFQGNLVLLDNTWQT